MILLLLACAGDAQDSALADADTDTDTDADSDTDSDADADTDADTDADSDADADPPTSTNLLTNAGFEDGTMAWGDYGDGTFELTDNAYEGTQASRLYGSPFALRYQRAPIEQGGAYVIEGWVTGGGTGDATLKIEFHDASDVKLSDTQRPLSAPADWAWFHVAEVAPEGATQVTASLVGSGGTPIDFDAISAHALPPLAFDLDDTVGTAAGFGAQIWAYDSERAYRNQALDDLHVTHVRLEPEGATWEVLQTTESDLDSRGIETMLLEWSAPGQYSSGSNMLEDPQGFAEHWADQVQDFDDQGLRPEWIELSNEPDSGGAWSTGMTPTTYDALVLAVRSELDDRGFTDVGIVGPGTAAIDWGNGARNFLLGLSDPSVMAALSVHTWDDGTTCSGGADCITRAWPDFANAMPVDLPVFVSEYATKETTYGDRTFILPDDSGTGNASWAAPYAVRMVENLVALYASGADVPFVWQLNDEYTTATLQNKAWGLVALDGSEKPAYAALKTVVPAILGLDVVRSPVQDTRDHYAAVFTGDRTVVVVTHEGTSAAEVELDLYHCSLGFSSAEMFAMTDEGDPDAGVADGWEITTPEVAFEANAERVCTISLEMPAWSTATLVLE